MTFYHCRNQGGDVIGYFKRKGAIKEDVLSYDLNRLGQQALLALRFLLKRRVTTN